VLFQPFTERDVRLAVDRLSHLLAEYGLRSRICTSSEPAPGVCVVAAVGS